MKMMGAAEFKTHCLRILDEVNETGEPVTITKRGRVVGVLNPGEPAQPKRPLEFGCMKGSVIKHDDRPFEPAIEPDAWDAVRGEWEPQA